MSQDDSTSTNNPDNGPGAELDPIGLSTRPASLLVVNTPDVASRLAFDRALGQMGGAVLERLPPRLVIAQVPDGADAALTQLGMVARFDDAVADTDLAGITVPESRFVAVYDNRWHPDTAPPPSRIVTSRAVRLPGEALEASPTLAPGAPTPDPEDTVSVPYASGNVVVSIILPESNGSIDPSIEDWSEDAIRQTYLKIATALDIIASQDPDADLHFTLHLESAPAAGGLEGTVDTGYEFGKRAQWNDWADESLATADVLAHVLGHAVDPNNVFDAAYEYQLKLRNQYGADAAYFYIVAADADYQASLRAHAYLNGPWTVLDSSYGFETFTHETGHIFGAQDEYCPDACIQPTALTGYLGAINANAAYHQSTDIGAGIDQGMGENASSLMQYNDPAAIQGYTRAAWGWLDRDGDGIVDVRDTFPQSALVATVTGQSVRLTGQVTDRPATPLWHTPYSMNRIVGLSIGLEKNGTLVDTLDLPLAGDTRGRQPVDLTLPTLPAGTWTLRVRAKNEVGNVEPVAQAIVVTTTGTVNAAPIAHLDLPAAPFGTATPVALHARAVDLDGTSTQVRIDVNGDGSYETAWGTTADLTVTPTAGLWTVAVQARDSHGKTSIRRVQSLVVAGAPTPKPALSPVPTLVFGTINAPVTVTATAPGADLDWSAHLVTDDGKFNVESGYGASATQTFNLPAPQRLVTSYVDLSAGTAGLTNAQVTDIVALDPTTVVVAAGASGIFITDLTDPNKPRLLSHLDLETIATHLFVDGNRLYVLGTQLAVVDIHDRTQPVEIKQIFSTTAKRTASMTDGEQIVESPDYGIRQDLFVPAGERITDTKITVEVDHPNPAQLVITLYPPKQDGIGPIVLRNQVAATPGDHKFTFTETTTPALKALEGQFPGEDWQIEIKDVTVDGVVGTAVGSSIQFATRGRGAPVIANASAILGKTSLGAMIVAGDGVESLDLTVPQWITPMAKISGTGTRDGVLVGDTAVIGMPLTAKGTTTTPTLLGLVAVDFSYPFFPHIVRKETGLGVTAEEMVKIGSRIYMAMVPDERGTGSPYTSVVSAYAFATGSATWELGRTGERVDHHAFGDSQKVWTMNSYGSITRLDVHNPAAIAVLVNYPQTTGSWMLRLGTAGDILIYLGGATVEKGNLNVLTATLSRTYQIALQAKNSAGTIGRAYRTVQVIPYDHPPVITSSAVISGAHAGDTYDLQVTLYDPDVGQIWDPNLLVRADWDGDGVFDSDWTLVPNQAGATVDFKTTYATAGTFHPVFEVRDGYWATNQYTGIVLVQ